MGPGDLVLELALLADDTEATIGHARRALDLAGDDDVLQRGAGAALVGLALGLFYRVSPTFLAVLLLSGFLTAIVTAAGMLNALEIVGKTLPEAKIVCLGAGAAATSCMKLLVSMGAKIENIFMVDRKGVIHAGRDDLNQYKAAFAHETDKRSLFDALDGADVFVGLSGANLLEADGLKRMAANPIVFACSNPDPEISPALAHATRDDVIMATGRSDYPNQVNNVLCFPFIFRGALDVRASVINDEMKLAAVNAIRAIAKEPVPAEVLTAAKVAELSFGKTYIIPKPMDPRLLPRVAKAVAEAAVASGVARIPLPDNYYTN